MAAVRARTDDMSAFAYNAPFEMPASHLVMNENSKSACGIICIQPLHIPQAYSCRKKLKSSC